MLDTGKKKLLIFISHASEDSAAARRLSKRLSDDGFDPWTYEDRLLPGQDWNLEIEKALHASDAILLCFSNVSVNKEGYVQREYKRALKIQEEKPEGTIFMIPVRLDDCEVPISYRDKQWVDYPDDYDKLRSALQSRAGGIPKAKKTTVKKASEKSASRPKVQPRSHTTTVQGNIIVHGNYINGDQHNTNTTQTISNYLSPVEYIDELQKLKAEIEALKAIAEPAEARRLAAVEGDVQDVLDESKKEEPSAEKIRTTLDGARETMEKLSGSLTAAVGLGTTLGNLALMALKVFGR